VDRLSEFSTPVENLVEKGRNQGVSVEVFRLEDFLEIRREPTPSAQP